MSDAAKIVKKKDRRTSATTRATQVETRSTVHGITFDGDTPTPNHTALGRTEGSSESEVGEQCSETADCAEGLMFAKARL